MPLPQTAAAETFAQWAAGLTPEAIPPAVREALAGSLLDVVGLCLAARETDYVRAVLEAWEGGLAGGAPAGAGPATGAAAGAARGGCTVIGHGRRLDAAGAALVNGTAAHGEDYDDTFEGTPVHTGVVVMPAVLAACEAQGRSGADALRGAAAGVELMCRMALVAPTAIHRAGFHPTAVIGALGAAAAAGVALGHTPPQIVSALGIAGSLASGIIEYLAEGTWTKRLHPGWAAQCGLRAAALARAGFVGPRTVLDGEHGFFNAFGVDSIPRDLSHLTAGLGGTWHAGTIAFKPYACGTMCQPFIDVAIRLAREGLRAQDVAAIECKVGEGTVHRLWEPALEKAHPSSAYSAKFSGPFCIAVGLMDQAAGLAQFTDARAADPATRALAAKVRYVIDPADEYPANYSGHLRVTRTDGRVVEARQPHLRGGKREPLPRAELEAKFLANAAYAGIGAAEARRRMALCAGLFDAPDFSGLAGLGA